MRAIGKIRQLPSRRVLDRRNAWRHGLSGCAIVSHQERTADKAKSQKTRVPKRREVPDQAGDCGGVVAADSSPRARCVSIGSPPTSCTAAAGTSSTPWRKWTCGTWWKPGRTRLCSPPIRRPCPALPRPQGTEEVRLLPLSSKPSRWRRWRRACRPRPGNHWSCDKRRKGPLVHEFAAVRVWAMRHYKARPADLAVAAPHDGAHGPEILRVQRRRRDALARHGNRGRIAMAGGGNFGGREDAHGNGRLRSPRSEQLAPSHSDGSPGDLYVTLTNREVKHKVPEFDFRSSRTRSAFCVRASSTLSEDEAIDLVDYYSNETTSPMNRIASHGWQSTNNSPRNSCCRTVYFAKQSTQRTPDPAPPRLARGPYSITPANGRQKSASIATTSIVRSGRPGSPRFWGPMKPCLDRALGLARIFAPASSRECPTTGCKQRYQPACILPYAVCT